MEFIDHPKVLLFIAIISIPLYAVLARGLWGNRIESLRDLIDALMRPDIIALFKGKYWEDQLQEEKLLFFLFLCAGWACAITEFLARYFI